MAEPRVLHVITDPRARGAQRLARDLHAELVRRGQQSELTALHPHPDADPGDPAPVLGPSRHHPRTLWALRRAAARADVVVAHGSSTLQACAVALLGSRTPFVYVNIGDPRHWTASAARRLRVGAFLHRAAAVAAISPHAAEVLRERFRLPARRLRTLPNARAADRFRPAAGPAEKAAARAGLGLPAEGPLVAWIGALSPEKRPDLALAAHARLPEDVQLALAGEGPLRAELAPGPRTHLLGPLADPAPLYRAADLLLLTSDSEGVPGVLIEAALAGLPAVATDVGWVSDVVRPGETGLLTPPDDPAALTEALRTLLAADRTGYGAAARAHALAHFELDVVATGWQQLLREVTRR
ncbi:glycosyltransferase [Streptomyces sp. TLI_171]|uniref:glycosyltransferase n=1 Tax=Streptomyces sp. TLI_171 TaxID=1938859 RepID=UPI000C1888B1|nr:glycosyltransferase [Streptomyces sp. TLI_171]RKE18235.1 glycosyltransferase involved in cell wall biosynthesis [Streptomyces sp. TLI_171]